MIDAAQSTGAGIVYADYDESGKEAKVLHPLCDYQPGSVRDDFDFGAMLLFSVSAARKARETYGLIPDVRFAGLYDLRLKVSIDSPVMHLPEALYSLPARAAGPAGEEQLFAYLDPRNVAAQKEMEQVFTDYLEKIGAYVPGSRLKRFDAGRAPFPVEASVIIPVRNRKETIAEAVASGLSQKTYFPFQRDSRGQPLYGRDDLNPPRPRRAESRRSITSFPHRPASPSAVVGTRRFGAVLRPLCGAARFRRPLPDPPCPEADSRYPP